MLFFLDDKRKNSSNFKFWQFEKVIVFENVNILIIDLFENNYYIISTFSSFFNL